MANITKVAERDKLKPRDEPYWLKLANGRYLGFRKLTKDSTGTWVAYWRDADTGRKQKHSLGDFADRPASERFDAAKAAAAEWLKLRGLGGSTEIRTVGEACDAYTKHSRETKGDATADDMKARFTRWVHSDPALAGCELGKLTRHRVETWRKGLQKTAVKVNRRKGAPAVTRARSASTVNRDCAALRAALNYAHRLGAVASDIAWLEALKPTKNADGRRDVYLDRGQRRKLIEAAPADLAQFLRGLSVLPLRPGAMAALTAGRFDKRTGVLVVGKDKAGGARRIKLPEPTAAFLAELAKDKLPAAPLFARADGKAWDRFAWRDGIREAVKAAELPAATSAYALRHAAITDLVSGGLDLATVAALSGTSVEMIARHYHHLQSDRAAAALATLTL